jgi:hypothetical protein
MVNQLVCYCESFFMLLSINLHLGDFAVGEISSYGVTVFLIAEVIFQWSATLVTLSKVVDQCRF